METVVFGAHQKSIEVTDIMEIVVFQVQENQLTGMIWRC